MVDGEKIEDTPVAAGECRNLTVMGPGEE